MGECYLTQVENAKDSDFVPQKLSKLTGVHYYRKSTTIFSIITSLTLPDASNSASLHYSPHSHS
ncbi:hypothetical protein [Fischerella thermalis]|uniref:hypothetical protein n=1 Tax=Fischerella thermalis TaxID=372787 RepID=UPI0035A63CAC